MMDVQGKIGLYLSGGGSGLSDQTPIQGFLSFVGAILVVVVVLFLAYKATKFMAQKYAVQSLHGGYIEVLERVVLGQDRAVYIVRLEGRVMLLGVTAQTITKLSELDSEFYKDTPGQSAGGDGFSSLLKDALGGQKKEKTGNKKDTLS